jgi:hypothetical protein
MKYESKDFHKTQYQNPWIQNYQIRILVCILRNLL